MKSIYFIAGINQFNIPRGGEEFKNQLILKQLLGTPGIKLTFLDTVNWRSNPLIIIRLILFSFFKWDSIVISTSSKSASLYIHFLNLLLPNKLSKVSYLVIGGYFPDGIKNKTYNWKKYQKLRSIVLEGYTLRDKLLENSNLNNALVLPNFKKMNFRGLEIKNHNDNKFLYLGRITVEKGILDIIEACRIIEEKYKIVIFVDCYGIVHSDLLNLITNSKYLHHKGFLNFELNPTECYNRISDYRCLLFPTKWWGEGFPGVIVDAFIAGLPIIATDWNMNSELVVENQNGFLVTSGQHHELASKMLEIRNNNVLYNQIRLNNLKKAKEFDVEIIWPKLMSIFLGESC